MRENCDNSVKNLWELSDYALGTENCPIALIRKIARTSWRWINAYERGLSGSMAAFAVRKCSERRGVSDAVEREMNERIDRGEGRQPGPPEATTATAMACPAAIAEGEVEFEDEGGEDGE
jgi:hypothetical protein